MVFLDGVLMKPCIKIKLKSPSPVDLDFIMVNEGMGKN